MRRRLTRLVLALTTLAVACSGGGLPPTLGPRTSGTGPRVRWDLNARPLPEVPLPNDVATWPDPSSPTGRRLNASFLAPTALESRVREELAELDGWGTYAPISVSFDAPLDLAALIERQGGARFSEEDFARHAVYLVDLETGVPTPIDIDGGNFDYVTERTNRYYANDPRGAEAQILLESVEEDGNGNGLLDDGEDSDFDGVLDHPNTLDGRRYATPEETYDHMVWFWERETRTLLLRPILPLRERHTYAVVLTDRLVGEDGQAIRSPFDAIHHVSQLGEIARLPALFASHPEVYGDLATRGLDGVRFAWTFTTQTVTQDLVELRDGLYGRGRFSFLAEQFPPDLFVAPSRGGSARNHCEPGSPNVSIVPWEDLRDTLAQLASAALGVEGPGLDELIATYDNVDHVVVAYFETPFLAGDPDHPTADDHWRLDRIAADPSRVHRDLVPVIIVVPREDATHHQPFPVAFYGHGYTGANIEALGFAGEIARSGVATVAIDAVGHGLVLDRATRMLAEALFTSACLGPMGRDLTRLNRAVDLNADEVADPGGDFWSAYVFHTRDVVRQSVLDHLQLTRILRSFGMEAPGGPRTTAGHTFTFPDPSLPDSDPVVTTPDLDGDGVPELAGDFDADGTPDIGGWNNGYHAWGESLGAFVAPILGGVDPAIRTAVPTSGAGGLIDVSIRSQLGAVVDAVVLRTMGPLVMGLPNASGPSQDSACAAGETSLSFLVTDVNDARSVEFACLDASELAEGDAVVVRNLSDHEARCGGVGAEGRFRVPIPTDAGDVIEVDVYRGAGATLDYARCAPRDPTLRPSRVVSSFESQHGTGPGQCAHCAIFQGVAFDPLDTPFLVAPAEGFGLRRQSPDFRRFQAIAQLALEPADPINYVRHFYLEPITAPDVSHTGPRSLLIAMSVGDQDVPLGAGSAMARAAGLVPFVPADGPDVLADFRAPASFATRFPPYATPNELLIGYHVLEGVARLGRHPVPGAPDFLADVDDLGDGLELFTADGDPGGTIAPVRSVPPLRWTRVSVAATAASSPFDPALGTYDGISGVLQVYVVPHGNHGTEVPDPTKTWDESLYFPHLVGRYFATDGEDLRYHTDPVGHHCLTDWTCDFSGP